MQNMKKCSRCKQTKPVSEFGKNKSEKDGLYSYCHECANKYHNKWRKKNPGYQNKWRKKHPGYIDLANKKYRQSKKGKIAAAKTIKKWQQTENGKTICSKIMAKRKRNLGFSLIEIIPLSTWRHMGIRLLDHHHFNNMIVSSVSRNVHESRLGATHRDLICDWYLGIGIDVKELMEDR